MKPAPKDWPRISSSLYYGHHWWFAERGDVLGRGARGVQGICGAHAKRERKAMRPDVRSGHKARATVFVAVSVEVAFEVFTMGIDRWWRQGPKSRIAGRRRGQLHLEGKVGGRVFRVVHASNASNATHTIEVGRITAWEPPTRLELEWRGVSFKPNEATTVEVIFEAIGVGTNVTVEHRGWSALSHDHPARRRGTARSARSSRARWACGGASS